MKQKRREQIIACWIKESCFFWVVRLLSHWRYPQIIIFIVLDFKGVSQFYCETKKNNLSRFSCTNNGPSDHVKNNRSRIDYNITRNNSYSRLIIRFSNTVNSKNTFFISFNAQNKICEVQANSKLEFFTSILIFFHKTFLVAIIRFHIYAGSRNCNIRCTH